MAGGWTDDDMAGGMSGAWIAGTEMTPFGMRTLALVELAEHAAAEALDAAGAVPGDVQQVFFANESAGLLQDQERIRG